MTDLKPGIRPSEYNVLIAPEDTEEMIGSIILPTTAKEANDIATMRGRLVAVSPHAFTYADNWPAGTMPKAGDPILYAKYAGTLVEGADGREYRLCKDKDVAAILEG
jgi:chaperonin GroES